MSGLVAFAEVAVAILASLGVALAIEWCGLNGLMRLLPAARHSSGSNE